MNDWNAPDWLDKEEYPFVPRTAGSPAGRIRYLDEGQGEPVVFLHGNPTWSFLYRKVIRTLRATRRCIAPDLIGFGFSDKPAEWSYRAEDQASVLEGFLESLDLSGITLVVGDWGGPLGLAYAARHPGRVKHIVVTNTWCWPVNRSLYYQGFSRCVGGPLGRWLIRTRNFFARDVVRMAFGDRTFLTEAVHRHYLMPLAEPADRRGSAVFPREIIAATEWLTALWDQREQFQHKVRVILWGQKDIAFRAGERRRWTELCPGAKVVLLDRCGHFIAEEAPEDLIREIAALGT